MIRFNSYKNKNQKQLRLLCSNSAKVMLRLFESMFEFCLKFLALIQQQGKLEILLRSNQALIQQQWKLGTLLCITDQGSVNTPLSFDNWSKVTAVQFLYLVQLYNSRIDIVGQDHLLIFFWQLVQRNSNITATKQQYNRDITVIFRYSNTTSFN